MTSTRLAFIIGLYRDHIGVILGYWIIQWKTTIMGLADHIALMYRLWRSSISNSLSSMPCALSTQMGPCLQPQAPTINSET